MADGHSQICDDGCAVIHGLWRSGGEVARADNGLCYSRHLSGMGYVSY